MPGELKQFDRKKVGEIAKPRFRTVRDTDKGHNVPKFFDFWRSIPDEHADLIEVRVYRRWPICDIKFVQENCKRVDWEMFEGPINRAQLTYTIVGQTGEIVDFDVEDYEKLFNERYGCGEWRLLLNEKGVSNPLMEAVFECGDLETYPPKIDYRMLVVKHPKNEGYQKWLENQNIPLPWTQIKKTEGEEDDMAGAEALKLMADTVVSQSKQNAELAEKMAEARIEAIENANTVPDEETVAVNESIKLVTETARETNKMMGDMLSKHAGKAYDPVEMLKATAEFLETTGSRGGGSDAFKMTEMLMQSQSKMYDTIIQAQRSEIDTLKSVVLTKNQDNSFGPGTAVGHPVEQPRSFAEQLRELRSMSELMGWTTPGRARRNDDDEPDKPEKSLMVVLAENAGPIMGFLTTLTVLGANMIYNSRLKPGEQAVSPDQAIQKANTATTQQAQPGAQAQPQNGAAPVNPWITWLQNFEGPFLQHFGSPECNGYTLAFFIQTDGNGGAITNTGRMTYMQLKEKLGPKGLDLLIRQYHPIWSRVQGVPQQYERFLKEFFTYDEWQAEQNGQGEAA